MNAARSCLGSALSALACGQALALEPPQVFEKASPSVWVVRTYDAAERSVGLGSAVVIGPGRLVTNCHVLAKSKVVYVRRDNVMYQATLEHADAPRDLCLLQVAKFDAPAVVLRAASELKVGDRVFAIGNPQGLEVTLSEGLISGLRPLNDSGSVGAGTLVQTSAALSPGSSGGGLFDAEGRLVGITTFGWRDAQNLNIALPTDWIAEVPARAQAALAKRNAPQTAASDASAPPGLPHRGTAWVYAYSERLYARHRAEFTVRATSADVDVVEETLSVKGGESSRTLVSPREPLIYQRRIDGRTVLFEAPPYLLAGNGGTAPSELDGVAGYPRGESILPAWLYQSAIGSWEQIDVPAGSFRALRVELRGERAATGATGISSPMTGRFELTAWYSPEVRRYVKLEHKAWSGSYGTRGQQINHDVVELLSYRPPS